MKNQRKFRKLFKRLMSGVSALALSVGLLGSIPASADDSNIGYKYTLFAYSSEEGAITSSAANFCVNGNIATNGTISAGQNFNVNGEKKEHANEVMPDLTKAINEKFFAENVETKVENYKNEDVNINVSAPLDVKGKAELKGNIKLAAGVKAMGDITLSGGVLNNDNTVLFSENGNVVINSENVSLTGLVYAPKGNIVIDSKSLNLNSVVMIANKITLNAPNVNINNSASMAKFVQEAIDKNSSSGGNEDPEPVTDPAIYAYGEYNEETKSVDIEWYSNVTGEFDVLESMNGTDYTVVSKVSDATKYSINVASDFIKKYYKVATIKDGKTIESIPFSIVNANGKYTTELLDTDTDGLADLYEEMLGTDKTVPDTDKDGLTDYEEAYITSTDPTKYDSVTEGVSDADADNDKDGLSNKREIELKTDPNSDDTDGDTLKDGDEVSKYNTDPIKRDTDGDELEDDDEFKFNCDPNKNDTDNNGIIDGKEKHQQTLDIVPDNKEQAVTKVSVSMSATGNIEKTTTVESIMNKDMLCSRVVGLVGEPFSIESSSSFDKATITFTVDKAKLGETKFDDLMFLWYDRENDNFVELDTTQDAANSTVSIETTHFSDYMVVDSQKWFDNWRQIEADWKKHSTSGSNVLHKTNPLATILFIKCYPSSDPDFINPDPDNTIMSHYTNYRTLISESLINSMWETDIMKIAYTTNNMYYTISGKLNEPGWEDSIAAGDFCSDKTILRKRLNFFLNDVYKTSILRDLYWASIDLSRKNDVDRRIVYITDHDGPLDYSVFEGRTPEITERIKSAYYSVPVYFVCIGDFEKPNLEKIAQETGGKVYKVTTLNELYSELTPSLIFPEAKDTDKDGFSDDEETYGLIVDSSGTRYKTNPKKDDTDGDELKDNEEVEVKRSLEKGKDKYGKEVYKWYHHMKSDPLEQDSDGDGFLDGKDTIQDGIIIYPKDPKPLTYEIIPYLEDLCEIAQEYKKDFTQSQKLVVDYIRAGAYSDEKYGGIGTWESTSGKVDKAFVKHVNSCNPEIQKYLYCSDKNTDRKFIKDPVTGDRIDFTHFAATFSAYLFDTSSIRRVGANFMGKLPWCSDEDINNLAGWAGDLQTMVRHDLHSYYDSNNKKQIVEFSQDTLNEYSTNFYSELTRILLNTASSNDTKNRIPVLFDGHIMKNNYFDKADQYADIDAVNIYADYIVSSSKANLNNCIKRYYSEKSNSYYCTIRFNLFYYNILAMYDNQKYYNSFVDIEKQYKSDKITKEEYKNKAVDIFYEFIQFYTNEYGHGGRVKWTLYGNTIINKRVSDGAAKGFSKYIVDNWR